MGGLLQLVQRGGDWAGPQPRVPITVLLYNGPLYCAVLMRPLKGWRCCCCSLFCAIYMCIYSACFYCGRLGVVSFAVAWSRFWHIKEGKGAYSSSWNSPQNYGTPLVNGIAQCYLPPDRGDRPAFTPTGQVGTRFIDPIRMKGWVGLVGWLHTEMVYPPTDGHPSWY